MFSVADAGALASCDTSWPLNGRQAIAPTRHANVVTCEAEACRSAGFSETTPPANDTAATRHSRTPTVEELLPSDTEYPTTAAPANATAIPASRRGGNPSFSSQPLSSAISIGPMATTIAAVPASTLRSAQFRAIMYRPNHKIPAATIPGHAARGGIPSRRISSMTPSVIDPTARRPSANAPGLKCGVASRMATNAEAQSSTVTPAAASGNHGARAFVVLV